ncbi:hypothetical protein L249_3353 [Ophiocordyceps polyrhachis-furcata BCC 54312]|uniref:Ubiquitin carboxyl-terminal hydrolase 19 n=1 Tax=Ophiocordyceps polyrhachis-furcata BCC 54312 TaxID=1330021 RepID=A0A367LML4_9HYPO|nr:hypothetical protein L249_3353 [Ophiocordyceps polyrhachis-furcata BCC 54312]
MDPRFPVSREELYNLQMELKQVQYTQTNHTERLLRLEKRHADDAAIKSVWNSPFPGVIGGTPQHGPLQLPQSDMFDDLDEQGEQLLGSLHLGPAEEEPVRRGATSRANSVRFDESALHGSGWTGQASRQSGDFCPVRPSSGLMMERSLSHKSDGRHSSAGHSVHSGRASSLGLDTSFAAAAAAAVVTADDDSSSFDISGPPVSLYLLGSVPSVVRCWLTTNYAHDTLLYADVCTGSQKSTVDYSLLKDLDLLDEVERDVDGVCRARLSVYLAEAVVTQHNSRNGSPEGSVPSMTVAFEVIGMDQPSDPRAIRIYIGSDALRAYSADVLFSQNKMVLFGNDRHRLQVPFVRPEDDAAFRHICTANLAPEKAKLNANATPFVVGDRSVTAVTAVTAVPAAAEEAAAAAASSASAGEASPVARQDEDDIGGPAQTKQHKSPDMGGEAMVSGSESDKVDQDANGVATGPGGSGSKDGKDGTNGPEASRRESSSSSGIWGSWRQGGSGDGASLSGYQPASRASRNMKVLRPHKSSKTGPPSSSSSSYEALKLSDGRKRSQAGGGVNGRSSGRWESTRRATVENNRPPTAGSSSSRDGGSGALPRSVNPVGTASAFSWMTPPTATKPAKASTAGGVD